MRVAGGISLVVGVAALATIVVTRHEGRGEVGTISLTGTIEAREVAISSEVAARLIETPVQEGQRVAKGDLLFVLDDAALRLDVARLEARHATALAEVAALRARPRPEPVRGQRSRIKEAEISVTRAARELERMRALASRGAAPAADVDAAQLVADAAEQRLETERRQIALLEAGAKPEDLEVAERRASEIVPELERARLELTRARVLAPGDGTVMTRSFEVGELVPARSAVVTILDRAEMWVELAVDARIDGQIVVGQPAEVRLEAGGSPPLRGHVSFVADQHSFTPRTIETRDDRALLSYRVKVALDAPSPMAKPGMFATVVLSAPPVPRP